MALVPSSPVALLSAGAVVLAGAAYFLTAPAEPDHATLVAAPRQSEPSTTFERVHRRPEVRRGDVYVVVFNNSQVTGLAGRTAQRLSGAGWKVVGSDNWYGTIPSTTVYYPERLRAAGELLAKDLGIHRVKPAIDPMQMDRLTVILTADFAG